MENAIANHEFEKARFYSDEERKERENLRALREKYHLDESSTGVVGREDIEDVVSRWTGVPITSIKEEETQKLLRIEEELHKRMSDMTMLLFCMYFVQRVLLIGNPLRSICCASRMKTGFTRVA